MVPKVKAGCKGTMESPLPRRECIVFLPLVPHVCVHSFMDLWGRKRILGEMVFANIVTHVIYNAAVLFHSA